MTLSDINTKITNLLGVDTNTYTNANRLIDINMWYEKVVGMILDSQDGSDFDDQRASTYPIYTFPLTTNRDYSIGQTYNILKIKDVSITYDGTNYYRATPMDITDFSFGNAPSSATTQNALIDTNFPVTAPRYDYKYGSLFVYPQPNATQVAAGAAVCVEFFRAPTEFTLSDLTTGTAAPGIDVTFHAMLAYGPAYEYAVAQQLPQTGAIYRELQTYEDRLRRQYSSKDLDRKYALSSAYENYK